MTSAVVSSSKVTHLLRPNRRADRRRYAERLSYLTFLGDAVVAALMLLLSYGLRFQSQLTNISVFDEQVSLEKYLPHISFGLCLLLLLLWNRRAYTLPRILYYPEGASVIAYVCVLWLAGYFMLSFMFNIQPGISRLFCLIAAVQLLIGLLFWRLMLSKWLFREETMLRLRGRLLFIGWNAECRKIADTLSHTAGHPFQLVGVIPPTTGLPESAVHLPQMAADDIAALRQLLEREEIDVIMATDTSLPMADLPTLADICVREMVELKIVPSYFQIFLTGLHLESMSGAPVLGITALPLQRLANRAVKRAVDIVGSLVGLLLSGPLMFLFGMLVKRESPGAIFYRQVRVGQGGKSFFIYKIRSMRMDSENDGKARWAQSGDDRCTRIGRLMRRWNIDEVPQFWNVLKGDMSLVGPRPERPEFIENFRESIPNYNARHRVKPGITGWAQVNGLRGNTDLTERINLDLYYIENWNPLLDFQIMAMTFVNRDNAY